MGNLEDLNGFAFADQEYLSLRPILATHMPDHKKKKCDKEHKTWLQNCNIGLRIFKSEWEIIV